MINKFIKQTVAVIMTATMAVSYTPLDIIAASYVNIEENTGIDFYEGAQLSEEEPMVVDEEVQLQVKEPVVIDEDDMPSLSQTYGNISGNMAAESVIEGKCGENVTYKLDKKSGELVVKGTGPMTDYDKAEETPFYENTDYIKKLKIEEGVTSVGSHAFACCFSLEDVELPDSITTIAECSFVGCVSLGCIEIPSTVENIAEYSLGYYCDNGRYGTFCSGNLKIEGTKGSVAETYANEYSFQFIDINDIDHSCGDAAVWSFDKKEGVLTISGEGSVSGYIYDEDGNSNDASYKLFRSRVKKIVICDGITELNNSAFDDFPRLESVELSDSVTVIGNYCFSECRSLKSIVLPDSVEIIGQAAFGYCYDLENVMLGKNVKSVNDSFYCCPSLKEIAVSDDNEYFTSVDGVLYNTSKSCLYVYPAGKEDESFVVDETVSRLYERFEYNHNLKTIIFCNVIDSHDDGLHLSGRTIYYDERNGNWDYIKRLNDNYNAEWIEMSELFYEDTISIDSDVEELKVGEIIKLKIKLNPLLASDFVWESSDEKVARISDNGVLVAIAPGTTTVKLKSADNKYIATKVISVTDDGFTGIKDECKELPEEILQYNYASGQRVQVACEELNGIFFYGDNRLCLYSMVTGDYETLYTFEKVQSAYSVNNKFYVLFDNKCEVYDLLQLKKVSDFRVNGYIASTIGADDKGRIYLAGHDYADIYGAVLALYDEDGELLSSTIIGNRVNRFSGFNTSNDYFFFEGPYNYYAWGDTHSGAGLYMGRINDGQITTVNVSWSFLEIGIISRTLFCLRYLYQSGSTYHQNCAEIIGGKYLVVFSALFMEVSVFDADSVFDTDSAIEKGIVQITGFIRGAGEDGNISTIDSIGVRTVYNEENDSYITYELGKILSEYSFENREKLAYYETKYPVFNILKSGSKLVLIEREEDKFYIETVEWSKPETIDVQADKNVMKIGESQKLSIFCERPYTVIPKYESSNPMVISVTENGIVSAWSKGTADISCSIGGIDGTITLTVEDADIVSPDENVITDMVETINNLSQNNYSVWSDVVYSYLNEADDGSMVRVQYVRDKGVLVENYSKDFILQSSRVITAELTIFGGYYSGVDANYLVFGQMNENDSDDVEVMRVVKYDKAWNRILSCSVKGANTYCPFDAGSLRMTETDGKLYIHTCHEMYAESDSVHHQANMTFVINEADMTVIDSYYDVMNIAQAGYVSHSFNQFIQTDGTYVYRVDHGDAFPRAITLTKCEVDGRVQDVSYKYLLGIRSGKGSYNATGVSVGGFEMSADNCLVVGNSVDTDNEVYNVYGLRNIFLIVAGKDLNIKKGVLLTKYNEEDGITAYTPHLVKLNDNQFLVMWEEYNKNTKTKVVKFLTLDGDGNKTSDIIETKLALSDCKPVCCSDGLVRWYVSNYDRNIFFVINPYDLKAIKGEVVYMGDWNDPDNSDDWNAPNNWDDWDEWYDWDDWDDWDDLDDKPGASENNKTVLSVGSSLYDKKTKATYLVTRNNEVSYKSASKSATSIKVPEKVTLGGKVYKVTSISNNAFRDCKKLKTVSLSSNLTSIGDGAFYGCNALTSIVIPKNVKKIGKNAFKGCKKLKTVSLSSNLTSIGDGAFYGCNALTSIVIPKNVKKIGKNAFYGCKKLRLINIKSKKLKKVGTSAIKGIKKNAVIKVPKSKKSAYKKLFKFVTGFKKTMKIK